MQDQNQQTFRKIPILLILLFIVSAVVLLFTFGAIKYGWLFLKAQQITNAARQGARMAFLPDVPDPNVIKAVINMLAEKNIDVNDNDITITPVNVPVDGQPARPAPDDRPDMDWKEQIIPDDHPNITKIDIWKLQPLPSEASCGRRRDILG